MQLLILFFLFFFSATFAQFTPGKVFLFGGATSDDNARAYNALREATGLISPKIVVAISGAGK